MEDEGGTPGSEGGGSRPRRPSGQGGGGGMDKLTREELVTKCRNLLLIAQKAKAAKDEANAELKKLKSSKDQNTSESDALREMVEDLTEGKMSMTSKSDDSIIGEIQIKSVTEDPNDELNESLQRQLKLSTSEVDSLRAAEEELLMKIRSLQSENSTLVKEKQDWTINRDTLEEKIETLEAQNTQIDILKKKIKKLLEEKTKLEENLSKVSKAANELSALKQEKMASDIIVNEVKTQNKSLEGKLKSFGDIKRQAEDMKIKFKEMENKIEEDSKKRSELEAHIQELKNEKEKIAQNLFSSEELLEKTKKEIEENEKDNKSRNVDSEEKLHKFEELLKEKQKLEEDLVYKQKDIDNSCSDIQNIKDDHKDQIKELENKLNEKDNNLETFGTDLQRVTEERDSLAKDVDDFKGKIKIIEEEKSALDMQLSETKAETENRIKLMEDEKEKAGIVANEIDIHKVQIQELENKLFERENNLETFKTDLQRVSEERDSLAKDVADFEMKIKIIEEEKSALDMQFSENKAESENRIKIMEEEKEKASIVANDIDTYKAQVEDLNIKVSKLDEESKISINYVTDMTDLCRNIFPSFLSQSNDIENHEKPVLLAYLNSLKDSLNRIKEKRENIDFDKRLYAVSKFVDVFMEKHANVFEADNVNLEDISFTVKNLVTSVSEIFTEVNSLLDTELNSNHFQKLHETCEKLILVPSEYVKRMQKQMEDISLEKNTLSENISTISSEVSQLKITDQEKTDTLKEYSETFDKYQKEKQSLECAITEINEKNECLEKELNHAVESKKCTEERVTALESQITSGDSKSEDIINNLRQEVATLKTTKDESNTTQKKLQEEVTSLKREKEEANCKQKQMQNELASEKGRIAGIESELKSEILSLTDTNKYLVNQRVSLEEKCSTLENEIEDLRGALQRLQEAVEMYQQESQALNLASEASDKSLQESVSERSKLVASVQESTARCEELLTELNQMNQVLRERGERISRLEATNKDKTQELETKTTEINQLVKKVESVQSDLKNKHDQLEGLNQKLASLNTEVFQSEQNSCGASTEDTNIQIEQLQAKIQEKEQLQAKILEKDSEIQSLKTTIINLEGELSNREAGGQDNQSEMMSTSTMSRVEDTQRMKEIEDTFEERYMKLKSVAIKLKKRVAEMTAQLNMSEEKRKKLELEKDEIKRKSDLGGAASKTIQALTIEVDRLQDSVDMQKKESKEQNKSLTEAAEQLATVKTDYANCMEEKDQIAQQSKRLEDSLSSQEEVCTSLRAQILILEKRISTEEEKYQVIEERRKKATEQIEEERQLSLQIKKELEDARQESKNNSMIDLEMRDYEQTVEELNTQLAEKDTNIALLKTELEHEKSSSANLQEQLNHLTVQGTTERERAEKMKKLLLDHKTELAELRQSQEIKTQQMANDRNTIEKITQDQERQKLVMSEISAEKTRMEENAIKAKAAYEHKIESLEQQVSKHQSEATQLSTELTEVKQEFEVFKTRAHSVLQKKAKSPDVDVSELKSEKDQLVADLDSRQAIMQQLQSEITTLKAESSFMIAEKRNLERQVSSLGQEISQMDASYKDKIATSNAKAQAKTTELQLMIANMASQNEAISKSFKGQLESLQNSHLREVESLQTKLEETEDKLWQLKNTLNASSVSPAAAKANISTVQPEQSVTSAFTSYHRRQPSHGNEEPRIDITNMIREQGEGSEWVEPSRGSPRPPHHSYSPPSLEQLISAPLPTSASNNSFDDNASMASINTETTTKETLRLETKISALEQRVQQLTSLLHESEAENAKLLQLSDALKEEIRRSTRNEQREKHMENVEYIKNVILKFLLLKNGDERCRLIPVLKTVLQLSPQETSHIEELAKGGEGNTGAAGAGWGSYLHMWSGR